MPRPTPPVDPADLDLYALLDRVLHAVSTPTRLEMLRAGQKLGLLIEVLLGHPPIRGRSRPRDFPFAPHQDEALEIARRLAGREVSSDNIRRGGPSYNLYDWLVACALLGCGDDDEKRCQDRIFYLLQHLEQTLGLRRSLFREQIWDLLGLFDAPNSRDRGEVFTETTKTAVVAALLARHAGFDQSSDQLIDELWDDKKARRFVRNQRDRLRATRRWRIDLKAAGVQDFLDACRLVFIRRGASTWSAQTLALLRDDIAWGPLGHWPFKTRPRLLIDSNSVVSFWTESAVAGEELAAGVRDALDRALQGSEGSAVGLDKRYPLLMPYRREAWEMYETHLGAPERCLAELGTVFPDVKVQALPMSLERLAMQRARYQPEYEGHDNSWRTVRCFGGTARSVESGSTPDCKGRPGDPALASRIPPWYKRNPSSDESYGWAAFAYSLVGRIYRRTAERGLASIAFPDRKDGRLRDLNAARRLRAIDRKLGGEGRLALLKLDGDRVGKGFVERPMLRAPALSVGIESVMLERVQRAVHTICAEHRADLEGGLPLDLIYFGGDDLELRVPALLVETLLEDFATPLPTDRTALGELSITWSAAAIELECATEPGVPAEEIVAARRIGELLELAKARSPLRGRRQDVTPTIDGLTGVVEWSPRQHHERLFGMRARIGKATAEP